MNLPPVGSPERASKQISILAEALNRIACYDDTGANARLTATGSYGSFDEPASVQIARDAIGKAYAA